MPDANAYFITGNGDPANGKAIKDSDIKSCPALFVEWDDKPIEWQVNAWKELGLPEPSIQVHTGGKSVHSYWVLDEPMAPAKWRKLIKRLIDHSGADPANKNPSRLMRLPGSIYHDKNTGEAKSVSEILHSSNRRYSAAEIEACLPPVLAKAAPSTRQIAAVVSRQSSDGWPPRTIEEIEEAAKYIPTRIGGEGTYEEDRNALCGCAAALTEAGAADGDGSALLLLGGLWPNVAAARQVLGTTTTRNAASFWKIAADRGYDLSRKRQITAKPVDTTKPAKVKDGKLVDQLPEGWAEDKNGKLQRTALKAGDLTKQLRECINNNLRFNELTLYAEYNNEAVKSSELDLFYVKLSERGYTVPKKEAIDALISQAQEQSYHPVRDYLNYLAKNEDVVPADISSLASKYLNSTNPLYDTMLRKTLIGAVARVMEPGCKFDTCLVLQGKQGIGKSTFFQTLASPDWFCDTQQEQEKDFKLAIHSTWIYELAELETITSKKEAGAMKNLLSGQKDQFRAPYAAAMDTYKRASIFVATCNELDFLRDETGSRRYWVIPVPNAMHEKIIHSDLLKERDAIWKAVAIAYANGEKPFLDIQGELQSEQSNKPYEPENIWLAPMELWLSRPRAEARFTTDEALVGAGLRQRDHLSSEDQRRAAQVLRRLGYVQNKHPQRVAGRRARFWEFGTDGLDVSDRIEGSEPAETDCAGIDHSALSQISDKKDKTFDFYIGIEGEGIQTPENVQEFENDLSIRDRTFKPVALQPFTADSHPENDLRQALHLRQALNPLKGSDTNAIDRNAAEQRIRANGTKPELSWVKQARDMKTANPLMAFATVALNLQTDLGIKVDGRQVKKALELN